MNVTDNFSESQKFKTIWVWIIILVVLLSFLFQNNFFQHDSFFDHAVSYYVGLLVVALVVALLLMLRLDTTIDSAGIKYKWHPFKFKYAVIPWHSIESVKLREFSALGEFGGYGMRYSFTKTAYIVAGNQAIEIKVKDKKRLFLLGTQHPKQANAAIAKFSQRM